MPFMSSELNQSPRLAKHWQRSTSKRFLGWLFSWRILRRFLFVAVVLVTLVALLFVEENARGRRAWQRYAAELTQRGVLYRLADVIPPPVPDERNFVATPFWSKLDFAKSQPKQVDTNRWPYETFSMATSDASRIRKKADPAWSTLPRWKVEDLPALKLAIDKVYHGQTNFPSVLPSPMDPGARQEAAQEILRQMKVFDSVLEELQQASRRSEARFSIKYDNEDPIMTLLPHLAVLKGVVLVVQTKAIAELAASNPDQALASVQLMLRLADSIKDEPVLVSYLVRVACIHIAVKTVWEGMVFQKWTESQLQVLQARLRECDLIEDAWRAVQRERCYGNETFEFFRRSHGWASLEEIGEPEPSRGSQSKGFGFMTLLPQGWLFFEQVNYNRLFDSFAGSAPKASSPRINPAEIESRAAATERTLKSRGPVRSILSHDAIASMLLPAINKVFQKSAKYQVLVDQAVLACALERYRMSQGAYPATLQALVPTWIDAIPLDVVSGKPYQYRPAESGRYQIYSVGWNETDDKGIEEKEPTKGDWVWGYP